MAERLQMDVWRAAACSGLKTLAKRPITFATVRSFPQGGKGEQGSAPMTHVLT